ncbi:MAG: hypothetical protein IIB37_07650 [Gemmatimonadetes bacterium]|nr:hypothetical protein [Gemmatimonadota bacterium]MCH8812519.1 hypothetical protein [Gemmatimonadota bacterium]
MDKIDRLGWAAGITFVSYGLRIGIRVSSPEIMDRIKGLLPPKAKPARGPRVERLYSLIVSGTKAGSHVRRINVLYGDAVRLARSKDTEPVLEALERDLQLYVAEWARRRVFVHAGVVGWRGRAIVIPGRTMSGKTTLVKALVEAGATYYSDEYAVLDERGRVHPYPKPLSIRDNGGGRAKEILPEALGGTTGVKPLPVGLVVTTSYREAARWRPRQLLPGRAVMALLAHTVSVRRKPERALTVLREVVADALVLKGVRGEAAETAEKLLRRAEQAARGS